MLLRRSIDLRHRARPRARTVVVEAFFCTPPRHPARAIDSTDSLYVSRGRGVIPRVLFCVLHFRGRFCLRWGWLVC